MNTTDPIEVRDLIMRDVLHSDVMKPFLTDDAVVNATMWRFLQTGVSLLAASGLLAVPEASDTTPAPLDPSAVKAGDTVTVAYRTSNPERPEMAESRTFVVASIDPLTSKQGKVYRFTDWEVTAHQPAPEPEPEWEKGTFGTATVRGEARQGFIEEGTYHRGFRFYNRGGTDMTCPPPADFRPLVVIDPATARKAVVDALAENLSDDVNYEGLSKATDAVVGALGIEATR